MIRFDEEEEGESTDLNEAEAYSAPSVVPQLDSNVESLMMLPHVEVYPKCPQPSKKQKNSRNRDEVEYNSRPQDIHYDRGLSCFNWKPNLKAGKLFSSKAALQKTLCLAAIRCHFKLRTELSSKSRLVVRCSQENCPWRVRGSKVGTNAFLVVKYNAIHKCDLRSISKSRPHSVRGVLSDAVKWRFMDSRTIYSPGDIKADVKHRFGFTISYSTAWRCRELALQTIRGSLEESFRRLPSYCYELERANPGTLTYVHTDSNHHFLYFFMAIGACIRGFKSSMRPVLAVDATHLKSKYKRVLFVATAFDGNRNIYHVAFGIGDMETYASWEWFFSKLRLSIGACPNLDVVSDRNLSIKNAMLKVFQEAKHNICFYHLKGNMKSAFKLKKRDKILYNFEQAAKSYSLSEFNCNFNKITNEEVKTYLLESGFHKWSLAHCDGRRYSIMTTNIAESINSVLRFARLLPVVPLIEHIRNLVQQWFTNRRDLAWNCKTTLCQNFGEEKLKKRFTASARMNVQKINDLEYTVRDSDMGGRVHFGNKTCSCRKFDLEQLLL